SIPENEPGSSIMPGKVNPTQCESVTMVAVQVISNDVAVGMAASQGNFELNVFMPVCAYNFLQSVTLLADSMISFEKNCVRGIRANKEKMADYLNKSLMLVTCLTPKIGYEKAAEAAKYASRNGCLLKDAVLELNLMSAEEFDKTVDPSLMV
ncbi:MAG: lyase family protein, partial [bacterium]|nr:lyase family protein [bacterium]